MDEQSTKPKRNRKQQGATKQLRNAKIIAMALEGTGPNEIAKEVKMDRTSIYRILSSAEVKQLIAEVNSRAQSLLHKAMDTVEAAMDGSATDMTNGSKVAMAVLKTFGILKDRVDLTHTFPKPTIIRRRNGEEVILGTAPIDQDDTAA
jgi:hypothetical protein